MDTSSLIFIILSIVVISYVIYIITRKKRAHLLAETGFLGVYIALLILVLFPSLLNFFENFFNIESGINFIIYLSIFIAYFFLFVLYNKSEDQRQEITKLTREVAHLKSDRKRKK